MKAKYMFSLVLAVALLGVSCSPAREGGSGPLAVSSPDGNLTISLALAAKPQPYLGGERLYYRVTFKGRPVLDDSPLGLDLLGAEPLERDFEVAGTEKKASDATWENPFGAKRVVPDKFNELTVALREKGPSGRRLDIALRAYDEGVAFRYILPKQEALERFTLAAENTGFYFAGDAHAYALNRGRFNTDNEGEYARTALRDIKPSSIINLPLLVDSRAASGPLFSRRT